MYANTKFVKESGIYPEIIFNDNIEKIRAYEYSIGAPPQAIKFDIFESNTNNNDLKQIRI